MYAWRCGCWALLSLFSNSSFWLAYLLNIPAALFRCAGGKDSLLPSLLGLLFLYLLFYLRHLLLLCSIRLGGLGGALWPRLMPYHQGRTFGRRGGGTQALPDQADGGAGIRIEGGLWEVRAYHGMPCISPIYLYIFCCLVCTLALPGARRRR